MAKPLRNDPRMLQPHSVAFSSSTSELLLNLADFNSTPGIGRIPTIGIMCSLAIKWFCDGAVKFGVLPMDIPDCMSVGYTPYPPTLTDTVKVDTRLLEGHKQQLKKMLPEFHAESYADLIRFSTYRYIGALQTQKDCALELVHRAQRLEPPIAVMYDDNIHLNCSA